MIKWDLFQGYKDDLTSTIDQHDTSHYQNEGSKSYNHINRCKKAFDKIKHPFMIFKNAQ